MKLIGSFLKWLSGTKTWDAFAKHWLGGFTFRCFEYPDFPMADYFKLVDLFNEDPTALYVWVCADTASLEWKAINAVTKANWGHCGVMFQGHDGLHALHMKSDGLSNWHLLDVLREVDNFAVLKVPLTGDKLAIAKGRIAALLAAPTISYNYQIDMTQETIALLAKGTAYLPSDVPSKLYCSEFLYMIGAGLVPGYDASEDLEELRFEPDAVYNAGVVAYAKITR